MEHLSLMAEKINWSDVPGVQLVGMIAGAVLLIAAIRSMFGKGGR